MYLFRDMDEVKNEYDFSLLTDNYIERKEDAKYQQQVFCDDISEYIDNFYKEVWDAKIEKSKILLYNRLIIPNLILNLPRVEAIDSKILSYNCCIEMYEKLYFLQTSLLENINEDNFKEISRLGEFCNDVFLYTNRRSDLMINAIYNDINQGLEEGYKDSFFNDILVSVNLVYDFCSGEVEKYNHKNVKIKK